jgi:CheY-like chemotaxis protein
MASPGGKTILVVDDDDVIRVALEYVLGEAGYGVVAAANGREALDFLRANRAPALILLDMMMPDLDGWTFLRVRSQEAALAAVPVLILTAMGVACNEWAAALGASGWLRKPIDLTALVAKVPRYLVPQG